MNEHRSQAELLDLYLQALIRDPQTPVPPGLDEKMAAFARQLMGAERVDTLVSDVQQRVWEKMMIAAPKSSPSVSSNGRTHSSLRQLNMEEMMNSTLAPRLEGYSTGRRLNFSLVAAALIVVLFAAAIIFAAMSPREDKTIGAVGLQGSATPQSTAVNTFTPEPSNPSASGFILPPYQSALISLEVGGSVEGTVTGDKPIYYYLIQGRAGDLLSVTVNASDLVNTGYFLQYTPRVGSGNGGGGSGGGGGGGGGGPAGQPITQVVTIPVVENVVIIFSVENNAGGRPVPYTIELGRLEVPTLTYGEAVTSTYTPENNPAFPYTYYDFVGQRGDIVDISVAGDGMDAVMRLSRVGESGELTVDDDSGAVYNPEILGFQLPADGTYRVELFLRNFNGELEGSEYTIALNKREPIVLTLEERAQLTLLDKYPALVAVFEGQAGQTIELTIEYTETHSLVSFSVEQNGQILDQAIAYPNVGVSSTSPENSTGGGVPMRIVREITVPAEGTVSIFVNADVSSVRRDANMTGYPLFVDIFDVVLRNR